MASDFVRNIKGVKNIDILSPNITTENDLISTTDGEVYVVTKKGYRKITGIETQDFETLKKDVSNLKNQSDTNTINISDLTNDIETNTSDIGSLKTTTSNHTSDIESLNTSAETIKNDVKSLKSTTANNTSNIESLTTSTETNTSDIGNLKTSTDTNTSDIETLRTSTETNTSEIETLNTTTSNNTSEISDLKQQIVDLTQSTKTTYVLFEGSEQGVGSTIQLNDDFHNYYMIFISGEFPGGVFTEPILVKALLNDIAIQRINLRDSDGTFLGAYEVKLLPQPNNILEITNDVSWDELGSQGSGAGRNSFSITNIEGVK